MTDQADIEQRFWKSLRSDMTVMLGLDGVENGHAQPMTAQFADDNSKGPIWFFTARNSDLVRELDGRSNAIAHFASKGHDLFASIDGTLERDNDPAMIEKLWNPFVAAWFKGGKTDPNLQLLKFDPAHAQIWLNDHSFLAGIKLLLGRDPKVEYQNKVAEIRL
jgi:general stress protein 26